MHPEVGFLRFWLGRFAYYSKRWSGRGWPDRVRAESSEDHDIAYNSITDQPSHSRHQHADLEWIRDIEARQRAIRLAQRETERNTWHEPNHRSSLYRREMPTHEANDHLCILTWLYSIQSVLRWRREARLLSWEAFVPSRPAVSSEANKDSLRNQIEFKRKLLYIILLTYPY